MNFSKAKSILIVFLIIVNLSLLTYIIYDRSVSQKHKETVTNTCIELLEKNGISVDLSLIESQSSITKINTAYAKNYVEGYLEFSKKFLGDNVATTDNLTYTSEKGAVSFSGDLFKFTPKDVISPQKIDAKNAGQVASSYLKTIGINQDNKEFMVSVTENGLFSVRLSKTINSYPVFGSYFTVLLSDKGIVGIEGIWYEENKKTDDTYVINGITNALTEYISKLPEHSNTTITSITLGYSTLETGVFHENVSLIPVWRIENDLGKIVYIDAREEE